MNNLLQSTLHILNDGLEDSLQESEVIYVTIDFNESKVSPLLMSRVISGCIRAKMSEDRKPIMYCISRSRRDSLERWSIICLVENST
jgi:hypothetical protein